MKKTFVLAVTVLALGSLSFAGTSGQTEGDGNQQADNAVQESIAPATSTSPDATTFCSYSFTSGSNNSFLQYCVTANGNIPRIETPLGKPQLGRDGEGYGLCQESPAVEYHDYATGDSGNWKAPVLVSLTTTAVKIARTTSDGHFTLTQTITKVPQTSSITIAMAITNHQAVAKKVYLVRYADSNPNGSAGQGINATHNGVYSWLDAGDFPAFTPGGLQLQNVGNPPFLYWQGFARTVDYGPNACDFAANSSTTPFISSDASMALAYAGTVYVNGTKTVTVTYRGM